MATERLAMSNFLEILRQKLELGRSHREVAQSLGISVGSVSKALRRLQSCGLSLEDARSLSEPELELRLYGYVANVSDRPQPDCAHIHRELRRPGVTLQLLHMEYLEQHLDGYQYTQFCERYRRWRKRQRSSMRQVHRAGEKVFVDYSGKRPSIVNRHTGELIGVELFVGAMGASHRIFAEATMTQRGPDWIGSHVRMLESMGGTPGAIVCDQLKSGVIKACKYEPGLQRTYQEMARHYGTTILPARPRAPKDKAKAEVAVQIAQRWILARLRNETFFTLRELNTRIAELLAELNARNMKGYEATRDELFDRYDRPALSPLPTQRFVFFRQKEAKVNIDYHVSYEKHHYSVPHTLLHEYVRLHVTEQTVEVFHKGRRVASHVRSSVKGGYTTVPEHMPAAHRAHAEWSPSRLIRWGEKVGPFTGSLIEAILHERKHPEQGYRSCLGLMRLSKRYSIKRMETACERALEDGTRSYRYVNSMLKSGLDKLPRADVQQELPLRATHEHVRGPAYYDPKQEKKQC
jgi:transposase